MAPAEKVKAKILEIAARPNNVTISDIDWVMNQLKQFGEVTVSGNVHQRVWRFEGEIFSVCIHNKSKQIKSAYVRNFLNAMVKAGWYE